MPVRTGSLPLPGGGLGWVCALAFALLVPALGQAQPAAPPAPAASAASAVQQVEIRSGRPDETEQRRQSTAAKIVIGREELDRFGDSTVGEILRRLPGVTMPGAPGRGGAPRMRGLGAGYTQLLLDGERVPPGFSLETLSPEQIERIEILRAPTAETGARAIAGTINIITREGLAKKLNDVKIGLEHENGRTRPSLNWVRNVKLGERWNANLSLSAQRQDRRTESTQTTTVLDQASGALVQRQAEQVRSLERREHFTLGTRLQWVGEQGQMWMLMPFVVHSQGSTGRAGQTGTPFGEPVAAYDHVQADSEGSFTLLRVNTQWRQRLPQGTRLELHGGAGGWDSRGSNARDERAADDSRNRLFEETTRARERSGNLVLKATHLLENDHSLVGGAELERVVRSDERLSFEGGVQNTTGDFGDNLKASNTRAAAYLQDEWNLTPNWAAHAGLRWEQITTRGAAEGGLAPAHRSAVWTPLLHAVWKPDPKSRDQVRFSLTRSYRAPSMGSLIARPALSSRCPVGTPNTPTCPDRAGNPDLRPELATGLDIAFERYLGAGGVLSASLFHRQIGDLMRTLIVQELPSWSPTVPRWVARPQNIGDAITQGIELEAKFRLTELWPEALPMDLRTNASFYRSRVESVPGPDNRLEQQPHATLNLGADYRFRGLPLAIGGNLGWTPGYNTRLTPSQWATTGRKRVVDAYALWSVDPTTQLRLTAGNAAPHDYVSSTRLDIASSGTREFVDTLSPSYVIWQLRLEMKL